MESRRSEAVLDSTNQQQLYEFVALVRVQPVARLSGLVTGQQQRVSQKRY